MPVVAHIDFAGRPQDVVSERTIRQSNSSAPAVLPALGHTVAVVIAHTAAGTIIDCCTLPTSPVVLLVVVGECG